MLENLCSADEKSFFSGKLHYVKSLQNFVRRKMSDIYNYNITICNYPAPKVLPLRYSKNKLIMQVILIICLIQKRL